MTLRKKTLKDILAAGNFDVSDQLRRAFENLDKNEIHAALDATDLTERQKKQLVEQFSNASPSPFDIQKLSKVRRWRPYIGRAEIDAASKKFGYTHQDLVHEAVRKRPKGVENDVTDFSGWVFSLYYDRPNKESQDAGKKAERKIADYIKSRHPPLEYSDWELKYRDAGVEVKPPPKNISKPKLMLNGKPMRARPDFVFRNQVTREVLIVEIKASLADIPSDGWPNLRAQLWAYAQIDDWVDAPRIILIGEIWCAIDGRVHRRHVHRWERSEEKFDRENSELFDLYRGTHNLLKKF